MVPISRGNVKDKIRWVKNWVYNKNFGRFWGFSNFRTPLEAKLGVMLLLIIGFGLNTFHTTNLAGSQCSGARFMMRWDEFKTEFIARFSGSFWGFSYFHTPLAAKIGCSSPLFFLIPHLLINTNLLSYKSAFYYYFENFMFCGDFPIFRPP